MCGIAGFRRFGNAPPVTQEQIELMLVGLQNRGIDATGLAILNIVEGAATIDVYKDNVPAWELIHSTGYEEFIQNHLSADSKTILLHTRQATIGNPNKTVNNHPMYWDRVAVVHNGSVNNHESLFRDMQLERHAETDSDILRAILDAEGFTKKGIRQLARCTGPIAMAAVDPEDPFRLLLVRSGSPLVLAKYTGGATDADSTLVWASERHHIYKAMRGWETWLGQEWQKPCTNLSFMQMHEDSAWIINEEGVEWHDNCSTVYKSWTEPRRRIFDNYVARKTRFALEAGKTVEKPVIVKTSDLGHSAIKKPIRIPCNNQSCRKLNKIDQDTYNGIDLASLKCGSCKTPLLYKPN